MKKIVAKGHGTISSHSPVIIHLQQFFCGSYTIGHKAIIHTFKISPAISINIMDLDLEVGFWMCVCTQMKVYLFPKRVYEDPYKHGTIQPSKLNFSFQPNISGLKLKLINSFLNSFEDFFLLLSKFAHKWYRKIGSSSLAVPRRILWSFRELNIPWTNVHRKLKNMPIFGSKGKSHAWGISPTEAYTQPLYILSVNSWSGVISQSLYFKEHFLSVRTSHPGCVCYTTPYYLQM